MDENDASVARLSDEDAALVRQGRFGELPSRVRPEEWVEETETGLPAHELEQSISIVQHPGRTYET
ncbi:MAG TPA: hypothetical protein VFM54_08910 [Micromonosporaceae bacterium]|nr:hypothetical protein [Micromonosporaceae bacterium]